MAIELQDSNGFELAPARQTTTEPRCLPAGACSSSLIAVLAATIFSSGWVWSPPIWLQPSVVGMLWGSLFSLGVAAGNVRRGSAVFAGLAGGAMWLGHIALQKLTSLAASECSLLVVCVVAAGWFTSQLDDSAERQPSSAARVRRYRQWTIWDIAWLTTWVAVVCYALPRLESPLALLSQVSFVLWGGCLWSWVAYRWVFDDRWTIPKLVALLALGVFCFWLLGRQTPTEFSPLHIAAWMLTGPLPVIAAQGLCVMAILTAIRIDRGSLLKPAAAELQHESAEPIAGLRIHSA